MELICSFCRRHLGYKEPLKDPRRTHGMCPECRVYFKRQQDGMSLDEYLEGFDLPVMLVDGEGRVAGANRAALDMLGKSVGRVHGFLGGEVMECAYARLPQGCGNTTHCEACTIRRAVQRTLETRRPLERTAVTLTMENNHVAMHISTELVDGLVRVKIEDAAVQPRGEPPL